MSYQDNLQFFPTQYNAQQIPNLQGQMDSYTNNNSQYNYDTNEQLSTGILAAFSTSGYANEPELLEELGINFHHIKQKTLNVLNPKHIDTNIMNDSDLAGPILYCLMFGVCLLLAGKIHFGYIYGVALFGTVSLHYLFKLMSDESMVFIKTASVLGYCLLPLLPIAGISIVFDLNNLVGYILSTVAVFYSTYSASGFFVSVLKLDNVRLLIGYPLVMFYSVFVLMAMFVEKSD